jgi:hypothetical protein
MICLFQFSSPAWPGGYNDAKETQDFQVNFLSEFISQSFPGILREAYLYNGVFTRCDKVVPGLGATNLLLLLLLLLLLPVSEF